MNEIENILKAMFDLYFEEECYINKIHNDNNYIKVNDDIKKMHKQLTDALEPLLDDDKVFEIIANIEDLYNSLSNVYRYHDFTYGLTLGITLTAVSPKINSPQFIDKMIEVLSQYSQKNHDNEIQSIL